MDNFHEVSTKDEIEITGAVANVFASNSFEAYKYAQQHPDVQVYWVTSTGESFRVSPLRRSYDKEKR